MVRKLPALLAALLAAIGAGALAVTASSGSSHREAPLSSVDPTADDTDVYAFKAADAPNALTIVANWIPFEDPAGGPNFYRLDDRAADYLNVDKTGDGRPDVRYRFKFRTRVLDKNSFLYALPGVSSIRDPKLNVQQTYSVVRETFRNGRESGHTVLGTDLPVAPNNAGPKTFPNYGAVAGAAVRRLSGGGRVFVGQADDPFFVDLGTTFDAINIRKGTGNAGGGKDDLAGYNVHSFVLQVPETQVTSDGRAVSGPKAPNAVVGVWASTNRQRVAVSAAPGFGPSTKTLRDEGANGQDEGEVQVSRLGNPLVNEVVIPLGQKDRFNATQPSDDLKNFGKYVLSPQLAKVINILFPGLKVPETNRTDIVQALLTGIPGLTQIRPGAPPTDTLKVNLGVAPNPKPSRFGVIGGDTQGFPNGRRLADDVTDIELRVIGGVLQGQKPPPGGRGGPKKPPLPPAVPLLPPPQGRPPPPPPRPRPPHPPTPADPAGS